MSLVAQIDADLKKAMMAREADKLSVIRMLKSAVKYAAIEKGGADSVPTDADVLTVVRREIKKREDSITQYTDAGRTDLARADVAGQSRSLSQRSDRRDRRYGQSADGCGDESGAGEGRRASRR